MGREVKHGVEPPPAEHGREPLAIAEVAHHQFGAEHRPGMAGREVVVDDDPMPGLGQQPRDMAADVAGPAGDQDLASLGHDPNAPSATPS